MNSTVFFSDISHLPNLVTLLRVLLVLAMYPVAWFGRTDLLAFFFPLAGATDAVDGWIARRYGLQTEFGSRFDSVADYGYYYSAPIWFWWLVPDVVRSWWPWIAVPVVLFLAGEVVKLVRGRVVVALHLYSSKIAGIGLVAYLTWILWGDPPRAVFLGLCVFLSLAAAEEMAVCLMRRPIHPNARSVFHVIRERPAR
ncbi:MAG: hypothetical protein A2V83_07485 [Nitrospirae bacterium RBG_16_64_22]|nr:MAG: hypothetical protein A2V83_07485 [Nitrospirae bacterium RBG_16_64_22]